VLCSEVPVPGLGDGGKDVFMAVSVTADVAFGLCSFFFGCDDSEVINFRNLIYDLCLGDQ
jgi:hypothetical protein